MRRLSIFTDTPVIKNLVIINAIMFLLTLAFPIITSNIMKPEYQDLYRLFGMYYFALDEFMPWQVITHMFMHASMSHIFFNMFGLVSLGGILEKFWGPKRFLMFYLICGLGAAFIHQVSQSVQVYQVCHSFYFDYNLLSPLQQLKLNGIGANVVGASGAIFGVLAAFALLFPNQELFIMFIPVPIKAKYVIGFLVLLVLYMGISGNSIFGYGGNIAHFAHIGGALFGFIIVQIWKKDRTTFY